MSNTPYVRAALAQAALELVPPLIRRTLLEESEFREEYGFRTDAVIAFGDSGISIQRSELFAAIREILSGVSVLKVVDTDGRRWKLKNESGKGELPRLTIFSKDQRFVLPDFAVFSPDPLIRLRSFDQVASDVNLPTGAQETWRTVLYDRFLEDDEFDEFLNDIRDTPVQMARSIRNEIKEGKSSVSSLVPSSQRYYERLVGSYDGSVSVRDYASGTGRQFIEQLSAWRPYEGLLFALFLSSHSALTAEIGVEHLGSEDLVRAFDFLEKRGDRISQLGAIEVGLSILPKRPEIEPFIFSLVEQIRDEDVDGSVSGLKLSSALFILVDGELSRLRMMPTKPPFYRRLASMAQAALIHRQLVNSCVDETFCKWAFNNRSEQFYMQSLADMRLEPRWDPDFSTANQMKADFFGRIWIAAKNIDIKETKLHDLILGAEGYSIQSLCEFPFSFLPGPLEGAEESLNTLPPDLSEKIEAQLTAEQVVFSTFIGLVNSARVFRIDAAQAELAAEALKQGNYRLANVEDKSQLLGILNGLATVAAAVRNPSLADHLRILTRRYRHDSQFGLSIEEAMKICLVASASREEINDWREFCGDWLTELAFGELEGDDGATFHSHLLCLCHAVPELWVSCARADAALKSYNESR